ncbi:DUF2982 domain-containing protein [Colwelliaceae bacterium 6471]
MTENLPCIAISPSANRHGLFLTLLGIFLFICFLLISSWYFQQARLVLIFCFLMCLVITVIGLLKQYEPRVSFLITPEHIVHQHKYGQWSIVWPQIKRIGVINETVGLSSRTLPYVGISLNDIKSIADNISPRLASRLIHEQRVLLVYCVGQRLLSVEQSVINFSPFKHSDGTITKGPIAAFLHQSHLLNQVLGYHLYVNASSLDRPLEEFSALLQQCKQTVLCQN